MMTKLPGICVMVALLFIAGCSYACRWAHVRVRNFSSETLTDVRLVGADPEVAFGYCSPDAHKATSLAETISFTPDVAIEYRMNGQLERQALNPGGTFPKKLENRDRIIELQFTTNRVWTWTLKQGRIME